MQRHVIRAGNDISVSDELGFLYHLLDQTRHQNDDEDPSKNPKNSKKPTTSKNVEPLNFLRHFRNIPEANNLGLLDPEKLDMEHRVGACTRFMLEHINKELKNTDLRAGSHLHYLHGGNGGGNGGSNGGSRLKTGQHSGSPPSSALHNNNSNNNSNNNNNNNNNSNSNSNNNKANDDNSNSNNSNGNNSNDKSYF